MENDHNNSTLFNPQEMLSPFDAIKETDGEGREWWNSRKLARGIEYVPENAKWEHMISNMYPKSRFWVHIKQITNLF